MKKAIIGKKVGMTQIFDETGKVIPVTVIEAGPCVVVQKMTKEKEGYDAVQFGYEEVTEKKLTKPEKGHLEKAGVGMVKHLKEFRLEDSSKMEVGDVIKADMFAEGDKVDVTGISKGHGYEGVVKRCGFAIQRKDADSVAGSIHDNPVAFYCKRIIAFQLIDAGGSSSIRKGRNLPEVERSCFFGGFNRHLIVSKGYFRCGCQGKLHLRTVVESDKQRFTIGGMSCCAAESHP